MSELALKLIAENKAKHALGEDARVLDLSNCGIDILPEEIGDLFWLEELILGKEFTYDITKQPEIFETFEIYPNSRVAYLPKSISNLINLKKLKFNESTSNHYTRYLLSDLTPIEQLYQLEALLIGGTSVVDLSALKNLKRLRVLSIFGTNVQDLSVISILTQIEEIYLGGCSEIKDLLWARDLSNLKVLDIHVTGISSLEPISQLNNLIKLVATQTGIADLSPLEDLDNLIYLNLAETEVNNLFPLLSKIENGLEVKWDYFGEAPSIVLDHFCPLTHPPREIVEQGNKAILRYFEDLNKQGADQIYEAKLLLIGEGGAGKTTLCRKLFDSTAALPQEKDRTRGIDIHPLYFDIPEKPDKQFRLNIWDFAGQGKYQSAHSFFYTHRSLYVLVDDTRTLNENDAYRTLYNNWLQTTELFGGQSPVLVLHNEKEGCARTGFSLGGFQERFAFVHGELFRINLGGSDITKIADLRRQIERQALSLPHIGDTVPKTWVKVREALETERQQQPYISVERYCSICTVEGINDPERQVDLSRYFHDLGVFLHFQDNPLLKRDVFLQNQWVTDAVYKILDDAQIADQQRGRFSKADLSRLWHESTYRERRDELLALMLQFELCYQVQDSETYVCPQLLPGDIPAYQLGSDIPLQLKYEYTFMPKGLLYRLIVRLHRHIAQGQTDVVWNSGVVLERMGAHAEITESLDRRTISVRATGLYAKELITIINEEVERLHAPFGERLKVTVKIPCNCMICKASDKPHFYEKSDLDNRILKGKATVECKESFDDVPVLGLLEGVFVKRSNTTPDQIKALILAGETAQALEALCELNYPDAPVLKARFTKAQKEYLGGRIEYKEYEQIANQVNAGCLDLL